MQIPRSITLTFYILFAFSGFSSALFILIWIIQLTQVVGENPIIYLIIFMSLTIGLSGGSYFFGRKVDILINPLRLFSVLEAAIGLFGFLSLILINLIPSFYSYWRIDRWEN